MTTRRRTTPPVPMSPIHRRSWRSLWRRCSCGLKEPCIDRLTASVLYLPTEQTASPPAPSRRRRGIRTARCPIRRPGIGPLRRRTSQRRRTRPSTRIRLPGFGPAAGPVGPGLARMRRSARVPDSGDRWPQLRSAPARPQPRPRSTSRLRHPMPSPAPGPARPRTGRADHAQRRQDRAHVARAAAPGRAYGSGPPQAPPHHPRPRPQSPGPSQNRPNDGRRVGDSTS